MLFNLTRIVLWVIISTFAVFKIKASKIVRKKLFSVLTVVLCMVLLSVSAMFPIENCLMSFKNPETVFNYAAFGKIEEVVYGKDSCMIIYSRGVGEGGRYIIPKSETGYKIPNCFTSRSVSHKFDENGVFDVYNAYGTQDYYFFGTYFLKNNDIVIVNGDGDQLDCNIIKVNDTSFFYFYLNDNPKGYSLLVDGERISMQ